MRWWCRRCAGSPMDLTNSQSPEPITGIILCGGEGRRMGGVDKPLLLLQGQPLVAHVIRQLRPQVGGLLLIANRSRTEYAAFGVPILSDTVPGLGPLGGLHTALQAVTTPTLFVCPGDAPHLAPELVPRLQAALTPGIEAAYPHDGTREQPLFLLARSTIRPALQGYLDGGGRSVHGFLRSIRSRVVDATDLADTFFNVNTPDQLQVLERGAG